MAVRLPHVILTHNGVHVNLEGTAAEIALELIRCREAIAAAPAGSFECNFGEDGVKPQVRTSYPMRKRLDAA